MGRCAVCENFYDKSFEILMDGKSYTFDSFECAIHHLAPVCFHCGLRIVGHGIESNDRMFCCAHCARTEGVRGISDRTDGLAASQ